MIGCVMRLWRFLVESPTQSGRRRTLPHPAPVAGFRVNTGIANRYAAEIPAGGLPIVSVLLSSLRYPIRKLRSVAGLPAQSPFLYPLAIASALGLLLIIRCIVFAVRPEADAIQGIADDTFYYQKLACNFLAGEGWSFDGESKTTGFHLLFAYFLAAVNLVFGCDSWRVAFLFVGILASAAIAAACFITLRICQKFYGNPAVLASAIPFFSPIVMLQVTALMESWISIFMSCLAAALLFVGPKTSRSFQPEELGDNHHHWPWKGIGLYFGTGVLVTLSRTDGLLLLLALWACLALFRSLNPRLSAGFLAHGRVAQAGLLLGGGVVGLLLVGLHNILFVGSAGQGSAATKFHWSAVSGHSPLKIIELTTQLFSSFFSDFASLAMTQSALTFALAFLVLALACRSFQHSRPHRGDSSGLILSICSAVWLIAYLAFYSLNSQAIQPWYVAQILFPASMLAGAFWHTFFADRSTALIVAAFVLSVAHSIALIAYAPMVQQEGMLKAGRYLADHYKGKRIAAWNAGIISYFSGLNVINIDGLVNNDILRQIKRQSLARYIKKKKIDYVVDYEAMLTRPELRLRGGYSDGKLVACLEKGEKVDGDSARWADSELFVFRVKPNCL